MAKSEREILAFQEAQAAKVNGGVLSEEATRYFAGFRKMIDEGQNAGFLAPDLPPGSRLVIAQTKATSSPIREGLITAETYTFEPFTDEDKEKLKPEGGLVYTLEGETIGGQREGGRKFWSSWHNGHQIELIPSRRIDVVIYPGRDNFFVPGTFNESKAAQEGLVRKNGQIAQARLGIEGYEEILPEAPEVTEVMFKHLGATGEYLLGEDYRDPNPDTRYWRYISTNTPTNDSGSGVACVGRFRADGGPRVDVWRAHGGYVDLGAARWGVKVNRTG